MKQFVYNKGIFIPKRVIPISSNVLEGKVQCSVIDAKTKEVIKTYPEQKNLILNQGLNNFASNDLATLYTYAVAGTGNTPTSDDSGVTTAAQAGNTVTLVGGAFVFTDTATDAGKMIKWDAGSEARIVTITNPTTAVVADNKVVVAGQFTVYRTNQTGLQTEVKRSNTYFTGVGNCGVGYDDVLGKVSGFRTYDFTVEVGAVNYSEIGFSISGVAANNLNARILLGVAVAVGVGQQLRVKYTLSITQTPAIVSEVYATTPITGWATGTGTGKIQHHGLSFPDVNGAIDYDSIGGQDSYGGEPNRVVQINTNSSAVAHHAWRNTTALAADIQTKNCTVEAYTALNFYRDKTVYYELTESVSAAIRSLYISTNANAVPFFRYLIDAAQTKDNLHTLSLVFRLTFGRTLA